MTNWEFTSSAPIDIVVDNWHTGSVAVAAEAAETVIVQITPTRHGRDTDDLLSQIQVDFDGGRLHVSGPRGGGMFMRGRHGLDLTIQAPAESSCAVSTASADVSLVGPLHAVDVKTASGDVTAGSASGNVRINTASGDVWLEHAATDVLITTASGDQHLGRADGMTKLQTASGDVKVGHAGGSVTAATASGDICLVRVRDGLVDTTSMSGDVSVSVARGVGVYLDLASMTGSVENQLDETDEPADVSLSVKCRTVSGDITISRTSATADDEPQAAQADTV
jgi:Putative adhesin